MTLSIIVAATENHVIGKDGKMPWHLPAEAAYFKQTTLNHPIIAGRKNYEATGRPLPDRLNIIITRQSNYQVPEGVIVVHSLDEALQLPQVKAADETFIVGGQQIYEQAMPKTDKLYLTTVHTELKGDTFFYYEPAEWRLIWSEHHPANEKNIYAFTLKQFVRA